MCIIILVGVKNKDASFITPKNHSTWSNVKVYRLLYDSFSDFTWKVCILVCNGNRNISKALKTMNNPQHKAIAKIPPNIT